MPLTETEIRNAIADCFAAGGWTAVADEIKKGYPLNIEISIFQAGYIRGQVDAATFPVNVGRGGKY